MTLEEGSVTRTDDGRRAADQEVLVVLVTAPDEEVAAQLGRALLAEGLAACINVVPGLRSLYRWKGEIQDDAEVLLLVKTRADRMVELAARVQALHPYDVPEVLALPASGGSQVYLDWVRSEVSPAPGGSRG